MPHRPHRFRIWPSVPQLLALSSLLALLVAVSLPAMAAGTSLARFEELAVPPIRLNLPNDADEALHKQVQDRREQVQFAEAVRICDENRRLSGYARWAMVCGAAYNGARRYDDAVRLNEGVTPALLEFYMLSEHGIVSREAVGVRWDAFVNALGYLLYSAVDLNDKTRHPDAVVAYGSSLLHLFATQPNLAPQAAWALNRVLFKIGVAHYRQERYEDSWAAFRVSVDHTQGPPQQKARYNVAALNGRLKEVTLAVIWLRQARTGGNDAELAAKVRRDNDFDPVRESPKFKALLAELEGR